MIILQNHTFIIRRLFAAMILPSLITSAALSNVQGGHVTYGQAEIQQTSPDRVDILQSSHKAIIQWDSFNISSNEAVHFEQPLVQLQGSESLLR